MFNSGSETTDELRAIIQEKSNIEEQIKTFQQRINGEGEWLKTNKPTAQGYQEMLEELFALQAYVADLYAQIASLDEAICDLTVEQESQ